MPTPVIDVRGLQMAYGPKEVLHGVDLEANRGEVVALLGPNGAGKTTTIEILEGFRRRTGGHVRILGTDPEHGDEAWRARLGIVLQAWRDHTKWRVRELLHHLGRYYAPYTTAARPRPNDPDQIISLVGLVDQANTRVAVLSGGQRRRLDVAIGLVGNPDVLFLDEPTAGFDPQARQEFHDLVHRLSDLEEVTILLTTHDLDEAEKLSDRILILLGGKIVAGGSAAQLTRRVAGKSEVRYSLGDEYYVHATEDATRYVHDLFIQHGNLVADLEVRRATLEDVYMTMVRNSESGQSTTPPPVLAEVAA